MHRHLADNADYAGEGYFNGQLYRIGPYPGAIPSAHPDDKVFGELYRLNNPEKVLAPLDNYEGCGPDAPQPHEFVRQPVTIHLKDGTRLEGWIYLFNRQIADFPRIMSGRYSDQQAEG